MTTKRIIPLLLLMVLCATVLSGVAFARGNDEMKRAEKAGTTLEEIMRAPDQTIPRRLLERAYAIAVIPNMVKGAFGIGGRYGKGLAAVRNEDGSWRTPVYMEIGGGSFGLQLGVESTDLILVFTEENGFEAMLEDKVKLGAGASATAGPVGRSAEAGVNATLDSAIYSYSRSKGAFAGVALEGAVLSVDDSANEKVYGRNLTGREIAILGKVDPAPEVMPFLDALRTLVPKRTN